MTTHEIKPERMEITPTRPNLQDIDVGEQPERLNQIHSFSRPLAKLYGANAAILMAFLANRIPAVQRARKDESGYFTSIKSLGSHYPYLTPSTIAHTLKGLREKKVLKAGQNNKRKCDRTMWYSFTSPEVQRSASEEPIRFKVGDAVAYGVVEAVLLHNLRYWLNEGRKEDVDYTWHRMSASNLARHLPFPARTLRRALENLVKAGAVERKASGGFDQAFVYRCGLERGGERPDFIAPRQECKLEGSEMGLRRPDEQMQRPQCELQRPELNSVTTLIDPIEKIPLRSPPWEVSDCENTLQNPPAQPSGSCACLHKHLPENKRKENQSLIVSSPSIPAEGTNRPAQDQKQCQGNETGQNGVSGSSGVVDSARKYLRLPSHNGSPSPVSFQANPLVASPVSGSGAACGRSASPNSRHAGEVKGSPDFLKVPDATPQQWERWKVLDNQRIAEEYEKKQREEKRRNRIEREYAKFEALCNRHASPYKDLETSKTQPSEQKVRILRAGLRSRQKTGEWQPENEQHYPLEITYSKRSLELAQKFFELNPDVTAFDLLNMIDLCCDIDFVHPVEKNEYDEWFYERRSKNLTFLLKNLANVNAKLPYKTLPPDLVYLDDEPELNEKDKTVVVHSAVQNPTRNLQ